MRKWFQASAYAAALLVASYPASAETSAEKVNAFMKALDSLCLSGGSESHLTAEGDLELRSKIKDLLTGNIGAAATGQTKYSQDAWDGIIGGISKDMSAPQTHEADEARKCMREGGAPLLRELMQSN